MRGENQTTRLPIPDRRRKWDRDLLISTVFSPGRELLGFGNGGEGIVLSRRKRGR